MAMFSAWLSWPSAWIGGCGYFWSDRPVQTLAWVRQGLLVGSSLPGSTNCFVFGALEFKTRLKIMLWLGKVIDKHNSALSIFRGRGVVTLPRNRAARVP